ncbi:ABC transporter ATP-binding protein [Nitratireductor indicus]|uniref:Oligopeptide ABC transporter ATPase n=1 Tax=Nitratireductor indicus C115 TaxID=1231190 RepID=K2NQ97_9HYPH|nr:ABC transporter ATP-binding protein [Nitratireductor indicus]EKF41530.1 oligopeptide ABC transporter ATPase [Nitratireductor indicus C115]MDS1136058.1 ABC transporter ATP-binding protein [Nitratireductor indicus]
MKAMQEQEQGAALLDVRKLSVLIKQSSRQKVRAVDAVSFSVGVGETLALVGESGAGKSLTAMAIMRLHKAQSMGVEADSIRLDGQELSTLSDREIRKIRGSTMAMIFQDPLSSLNPVLTVERQLVEAIRLHNDMSAAAARQRALELLDMVRIPAAKSRLGEYSHRLSGGMRQRVMIAMALAGNPKLILADEPTTALDVTISAQILDLLRELQTELGVGMLFITHDLHAVRSIAHRVAVMYSGRIVETGNVEDVFSRPHHPYTEGLLAARPHGSFSLDGHKLREIPGTVPSPADRPAGCAFGPRCNRSQPDCESQPPSLRNETGARTSFACYHPLKEVPA